MRLSGQVRRGEAFRTPPGSKDSNGKEVPSGAAGHLPGHFLFVNGLALLNCGFAGYNPNMSSSNLIKIAVALVIGIALGLGYGWGIAPVEYVDVTPNILREDYRVDYVLMVAEAFQSDFNAEIAARRLAILGGETPAAITASALEYASSNAFSQEEIQTLQNLLTAMQTYQPQGNIAP